MTDQNLVGGKQLLNEVIGRFRMKGITLADWSRDHGLHYPNARAYLLGKRNGKKACEWCRRIVEAARQPVMEEPQ